MLRVLSPILGAGSLQQLSTTVCQLPNSGETSGGVRVGSEVQKDERFFPQVCDLNKRRMCLGN